MKKQIQVSYRDQLLELGKLYRVEELKLYAKTKKELQKQEKIFLKEYGQLKVQKIKTVQREEIATEFLSDSQI